MNFSKKFIMLKQIQNFLKQSNFRNVVIVIINDNIFMI